MKYQRSMLQFYRYEVVLNVTWKYVAKSLSFSLSYELHIMDDGSEYMYMQIDVTPIHTACSLMLRVIAVLSADVSLVASTTIVRSKLCHTHTQS